ncbi:hypothetical protein BIW11_06445, partial [Tropilaelaps mercedesae]
MYRLLANFRFRRKRQNCQRPDVDPSEVRLGPATVSAQTPEFDDNAVDKIVLDGWARFFIARGYKQTTQRADTAQSNPTKIKGPDTTDLPATTSALRSASSSTDDEGETPPSADLDDEPSDPAITLSQQTTINSSADSFYILDDTYSGDTFIAADAKMSSSSSTPTMIDFKFDDDADLDAQGVECPVPEPSTSWKKRHWSKGTSDGGVDAETNNGIPVASGAIEQLESMEPLSRTGTTPSVKRGTITSAPIGMKSPFWSTDKKKNWKSPNGYVNLEDNSNLDSQAMLSVPRPPKQESPPVPTITNNYATLAAAEKAPASNQGGHSDAAALAEAQRKAIEQARQKRNRYHDRK